MHSDHSLQIQSNLEQKLLIFHLRQELSVDGPEGDPGLFDPGTVSIEHLEEVLNLAAPQGLGKDVEALRRDAKIIIRLRQATMASDWELLHRLVEAVEAYLKDPVRNFKALEYFEDTHEGIETEALHNLYAVQDSDDLNLCQDCDAKFTFFRHKYNCQNLIIIA